MSSRGPARRAFRSTARPLALEKAPSGIDGLDELTGGGLPRGRPTLVCGGPGCGKTLFAMEFLVRGALSFGEPGVFVSFEESEAELGANVASLGFDLARLQVQRKIAVDHVRVERSEIEETGEYNLDGLFVRLQLAIDKVHAKRVVLDTIESLFSGLPNPAILRAELRRLFRWLKDRGQTVVVTGEQGEGKLTRAGLEEYVSDCVIFLDHRVSGQVSTRRLRVVKYRGSTHGTNEYPFLIDSGGISVLPITSMGLHHPASMDRVSTGIARLDEMLGGEGVYKGSTVLVSGTAGTGKTSVAAQVARAVCERGERCLYFAFEESPAQLLRNMRSIGVRLERYARKDLLRLLPVRPHVHGLEQHLASMHKAVTEFDPALVIIDPITDLASAGSTYETRAMLARLIDFLKERGVTSVFTSLTVGAGEVEGSEVGISSLIDTWILLESVRAGSERNRALTIIKSRGMSHSNQAAEYRLTSEGLRILDTYLGASGALTGSARLAKEAEDRATLAVIEQEIAGSRELLASRDLALEGSLTAARAQHASERVALERALSEQERLRERLMVDREVMAKSRQAFTVGSPKRTNKGRKVNRS